MNMRINKLPKNAVYDYTDVQGYKVYHTKMRRYKVKEHIEFGKKVLTIYSEKL